ncbi:MAG: tetratricopeptide repeat protein, partial [Nocardiopsaceae bacterium]|nr:tetratricopeptide repeat protein [Nocardiopsaceae bacterium]
TDLSRFEALAAEARTALASGETETAAALLSEAEDLWRGSLLADVTATVLVSTEASRTMELRLTATELRIGADLARGRHAEAIPELRSLVAEHPLREGLWLLLMRALDGAGRHAEALDTYGRARTAISDELGVDPGPELRQLYTELLAADATPRVPPQRERPAAPPGAPGARAPGARTPGDRASGGRSRTSGERTSGEGGPRAVAGPRRTAAPSRNGRHRDERPRATGGEADKADETVGEAQGTITLGKFTDGAANTATAAASAPGSATGNATDNATGKAANSAADSASNKKARNKNAGKPGGGTAVAEGPAGLPVPLEPALPSLAQLPADIGDFTGRTDEVRHLGAMLTQRDEAGGPGAVRIVVVAGTAGLGKTTLAVHAAHQVKELFGDGQLYVDLSGASATPAEPGEVLARFLRDLGVAGDSIPASDDERAGLYRTRLTGRRVLIVLDNARDAAQLRPLLPGTSSCAVLVTTRNGALGLASTQLVDLNTLSDPEALELFISLVGDGRPADEPDATAEVLVACAGLPLAIRICAARLAARRQWKVATLAGRLRDSRRRLDELQAGDLEVRASFQVSYDALGTTRYRIDPARVFRLLGLWHGRTISLPAATALAGGREGDVADALERLVDANLLESPAPDCYQLHDLLRVYATERAEEEESEADRAVAVRRLLHWYLATAEAAAEISSPHRYHVRFSDLSGVKPLDFGSVEDVLDWYNGERDNVVAATRQASAAGLNDVGWRLPAALLPVFNRRGNWADCVTTHRIALDCVRAEGNRQGEGWIEHNLGIALARMREAESIGHLERSLAIRREISDIEGEAQSALNTADAYYYLEGPHAALEHALSCLDVARRVGRSSYHAHALNNLGEIYLDLGRLDEAADCFRQVTEIARGAAEPNPYIEGYAMCNLGRVYLGQGRPDEADGAIRKAVAIHGLTGNRVAQAVALKFLGHAQRDLGQLAAARNSWTIALRTLT